MTKLRKRVLAVIAALLMLTLALAGCGGNQKETSVYTDVVTSYQEAIDTEWAYDIAHKLAYDEDMAGCCGFRTSGSDYEHKCADYLVGVMQEMGLAEVEKVGVKVDKWQFNDASFTMEGTKIDYVPASYAQSGTDAAGITAEVVNAKKGFAANYEGLDVKGKIVLVGVNQADEAWIDGYIHEAYLHGAAALLTYDIGGYAESSDEIRNIQDVCADDYLPTVSLSAKEAKAIKKAIKNGNKTGTLIVDNELGVGTGTSYNVVGKIKGKSSDQQIVISAHYDKYFYGLQDDCIAIANVLAIGKAMMDSNYVPENDIVFVCHGAEEWGVSGSQYDWTTGAWEMINNAHPEWAGKTLAMFNFELSGYNTGQDAATIASVPEFNSMVKDFAGSNLADIVDTGAYSDGISAKNEAVTTMEDGISYRFAGVPYFLNGGGIDSDFSSQKYHTEADNEDTYEEDVFKQNIGIYGSMAIVVDQSPALELDMTQMAKWMNKTYDEKWAKKAGADTKAFKAALKQYETNTKAMYDKAVKINEKYEKAYADGDKKAMEALRTEGKTLNAKTLEAFAIAQDDFLCVVSSWDIYPRHDGAIETLNLLQSTINACKEGTVWAKDGESGAADIAWNLNGLVEYGYYIFTPEGVKMTEATYFDDVNNFWGNDKTIPFVDTSAGTIALVNDEDTEAALPVYEKALNDFMPTLKTAVDREIAGLNEINALLTQ